MGLAKNNLIKTGIATLAGLLTMLLVIPINGVIAKKQRTLQMEKLKLQDSRIKLTNEILNGIKVKDER